MADLFVSCMMINANNPLKRIPIPEGKVTIGYRTRYHHFAIYVNRRLFKYPFKHHNTALKYLQTFCEAEPIRYEKILRQFEHFTKFQMIGGKCPLCYGSLTHPLMFKDDQRFCLACGIYIRFEGKNAIPEYVPHQPCKQWCLGYVEEIPD